MDVFRTQVLVHLFFPYPSSLSFLYLLVRLLSVSFIYTGHSVSRLPTVVETSSFTPASPTFLPRPPGLFVPPSHREPLSPHVPRRQRGVTSYNYRITGFRTLSRGRSPLPRVGSRPIPLPLRSRHPFLRTLVPGHTPSLSLPPPFTPLRNTSSSPVAGSWTGPKDSSGPQGTHDLW